MREREPKQTRRNKHQGKFITENVVKQYRARALELDKKNGQDINARRALRLELQKEYGLLEIEAFNILRGMNVQDYLVKYHKIEHGDIQEYRKAEVEKHQEKDKDWTIDD